MTETEQSRHGAVQVVITDSIRPDFEEWLAVRGFDLFRIPIDNDLDTYGVRLADRVENEF